MNKFFTKLVDFKLRAVQNIRNYPTYKLIFICFVSILVVWVLNYFVYKDFRIILATFSADVSASLDLSPLLFFQVSWTIAIQGLIVSYLLYKLTQYIDAIDTTKEYFGYIYCWKKIKFRYNITDDIRVIPICLFFK